MKSVLMEPGQKESRGGFPRAAQKRFSASQGIIHARSQHINSHLVSNLVNQSVSKPEGHRSFPFLHISPKLLSSYWASRTCSDPVSPLLTNAQWSRSHWLNHSCILSLFKICVVLLRIYWSTLKTYFIIEYNYYMMLNLLIWR